MILQKGILVIIILGMGISASALTLDEKKLTELEFNGVILTQEDTIADPQCSSFSFSPFSQFQQKGNDTILSIPLSFYPETNDSAVRVFINSEEDPLQTIHPNDLLDNGFIHIIIPAENQTIPATNVTLCAFPAPITKEITIEKKGFIGLYKQARFDQNDSFITIVPIEQSLIQIGQEIPVQIILKNEGGEAVFVTLDYRKYELEYIPLVKGETHFEGIIQQGERKVFSYTIKTIREGGMLLPPATLEYTNVFGEKITLQSIRGNVSVEPLLFNVKGVFLITQNRALVNNPITIRWLAKNEGINPLYGIKTTFFANPFGQSTISPEETSTAELLPSKVESKSITLQFSKPGTYTIYCIMESEADSNKKMNCQEATIRIMEDTRWAEVLLSMFLILIAAMGYWFIQKKGPPSVSTLTQIKKRKFQYG